MRSLTLVLALWLPVFSAMALGHSHGSLHCHHTAPAIAAPQASPCGSGSALGSLDQSLCALCSASANLQAAAAISDAGLGFDAPSTWVVPAPAENPRPLALASPTGRAPPV